MKTLFITLRAILYMTGFVLLWGWISLGLRVYDRRLTFQLPAWTFPLGIVLMAMGTVVGIACAAAFIVHGRGTPAPFDAPRDFVAVGPYRLVRNPMYLGGLVVLAGFGLVMRSLSILLFSLPWMALAHLFVILYEEPTLRNKFGASYEEYCRTVRRWIPRFP